jgi:hypothetical protein
MSLLGHARWVLSFIEQVFKEPPEAAEWCEVAMRERRAADAKLWRGQIVEHCQNVVGTGTRTMCLILSNPVPLEPQYRTSMRGE